MIRKLAVTLIILNISAVLLHAQNPDVPEPGSIEAIASATGDPQFMSPWVSYLPQSSIVPSPLKFWGRIAGAPGELVGTEKAYAYCRALAASPRVRVSAGVRATSAASAVITSAPSRAKA